MVLNNDIDLAVRGILTVKAPRKKHLKISSAANNYLALLTNLSIEAKTVDLGPHCLP